MRKGARRKAKLVYFTGEEFARVVELAALCGLPAAVYLRERGLGWEPPRRSVRMEDAAVLELAGVVESLGVLAGELERSGNAEWAAGVESVAEGVLRAIRRLA